jgi:hypothetical protein
VKDFVFEQDETVQNLAKTKRLSSKKSFEHYRQILVRVLMKVALNFNHFAWCG